MLKIKNQERIIELLVYALIKNTKIYNHELAKDTLETMKNIVYYNQKETTDELTNRLLDYWENMNKEYNHKRISDLFDLSEEVGE